MLLRVGQLTKRDTAGEQPVLWLGLAGFAPEQWAYLEDCLERPQGLPSWQICHFGEADAWLINGPKVRILPGGNLKVSPGLPTEQSVKLNLDEVDRPVAFALPVPSEFEPRYTFDPADRASFHSLLMRLEAWLLGVRTQFELGAQVIRLGAQVRHGIYHLSNHGQLLAVLDFRSGRAGVSPRAQPSDMREANWDKRAPLTGNIPDDFVKTSPAQLAWTYVRRAERDTLPERYRTETIYFRGAPRVPMRWLRDSQLMVLRELSTEPGTFYDLRQRTGLAPGQMHQDLTCLYYAGAITTTKSKAAARPRRYDSYPQSSAQGLESLLHGEPEAHYSGDPTAPAQLGHRHETPESSSRVN
jgi:hypothetical protein